MTAPAHVHHWRIETPEGRYSPGRCACGAERMFLNSEPEYVDFKNTSKGLKSKLPLEERLHNAYLRELSGVSKTW